MLKPTTSVWVKYLALAVLVLQNAALVLVMRSSQLSNSSSSAGSLPGYLPSTAVLLGELIKLLASVGFLLVEQSYNLSSTLDLVAFSVSSKTLRQDFPSLCVPALLYLVQNNFVYVAAYNLEPAPFQLLFQLKIFSTAILSVVILKRVLTIRHWRALLVLFVGVALVQLSTMQTTGKGGQGDPIKGLIAVAIAVLCSGLSGVWFERILKTTSGSIWVRNIQLSLISLVLAVGSIAMQSHDRRQVAEFGLLQGYSALVWSVVGVQSFGGLLVAVVVKYADNILKGFATSIATVLSTLVSVIWFDFKLSPLFLVGAGLVLGSAMLYNTADRQQQLQAEQSTKI
ncbi:hypothetical protein BASA81_002968 [Batrachochytrium salamandrivorans]|nr:hypothetical protein BASA81_002968 [Batrachochytrium salamandrivorans]